MSALRRILEAQSAVSKVPKVMLRVRRLVTLTVVLVCLTSHVCGQAADSAQAPAPAESLYLKLRSVGLDQTRVYKIREASLQRAALHISLDDGTIAFSEDAGGH